MRIFRWQNEVNVLTDSHRAAFSIAQIHFHDCWLAACVIYSRFLVLPLLLWGVRAAGSYSKNGLVWLCFFPLLGGETRYSTLLLTGRQRFDTMCYEGTQQSEWEYNLKIKSKIKDFRKRKLKIFKILKFNFRITQRFKFPMVFSPQPSCT